MSSTETSEPKRSLREDLSRRFLAVSAAALMVILVTTAVIYVRMNDAAQEQQKLETISHFKTSIAEADRALRVQADIFRAQLEFNKLFESPEPNTQRLTAFLASLGGQQIFTHVTVVDSKGKVLFRYATRSQEFLELPSGGAGGMNLSWIYGPSDHTVYRTIEQGIWLGPSGRGRLILYVPFDAALLQTMTFPSTTLALNWQGSVVAATTGQSVEAGWLRTGQPVKAAVRWEAEPGGPELVFTKTYFPPVPLAETLAILVLTVAFLGVLEQMLLGRWLRGLTVRLQALGEAAAKFGRGRIVTTAVSEALDAATVARSDEVNRLAGEILDMMGDVQQANADLRASEAKLRGLYELSPLGIALNHMSGQFIESNQAFLRICGYSAEELTQLDYWTLTPKTYESDEARQLESLERDGFYGPYEKEYITKDGRHIPVRLNGMLLAGADGRKYIWSIIEDITERKRSEERLRLSEENLSITLQSIGDAVIATDTAGLVTRMNPVAELLTGWTLENAKGQPLASVFRIVNADTRARVDNPAEIVLKYGKVVGLANHTVLIARDEKEYQIADSAAPIRDAAGNIMGVVLVFSDVTQRYAAEAARVSLEAQLRESQKMEAIGTLAGGIAHDFNNIIATILGNAELAFRDAHNDAQLTQESVNEIRKAARRARDLVNQILTFSRRQPTERKVTSLADLVNESVSLLRATLPARIAIEVNQQPDLPLVLADATQIEQVVINLATNAMQATQGKPGNIRICLDTIIFDSAIMDAHPKLRALQDRHNGPFVRLTVSDDGVGMDAATLARIFEPFFTTKPPREGTGLGLSVAQGIVQTHEGAITVDSTPGKGSVFSIYLPPADVNAGTVAPAPSDSKTAAIAQVNRHILYIDDDEALAYLTTRLLERNGHRVSSFVNQIEALATLRANPMDFDIVVTDYNMPGMSGLDVAREVNLIRADLPVALTSGFIDDKLREQAKAVGVCDLIFKTSAVEDFSAVIERLLQAVGRGEDSA